MEDTPEEDGPPDGPMPDDDRVDGEMQETRQLLEAGPRAGNRAGAMAFFALVVITVAALRFYLADTGPDAYIQRLDAELLTHAELSLASMDEGGRMTVVPNWPLTLYRTLRRDMVIYAFLAAAAGWCWALAARARGRRDAFLINNKLSATITALQARVERLERRHDEPTERKG